MITSRLRGPASPKGDQVRAAQTANTEAMKIWSLAPPHHPRLSRETTHIRWGRPIAPKSRNRSLTGRLRVQMIQCHPAVP